MPAAARCRSCVISGRLPERSPGSKNGRGRIRRSAPGATQPRSRADHHDDELAAASVQVMREPHAVKH